MPSSRDDTVALVRDAACPLRGAARELDALLDMIGGCRFVLLGEATHGTHEFYLLRAQITRRLVTEKGFTAVIVEADWPDAYRVNRHVRGAGDDPSAAQALGGFRRFPQWMWRNQDVVELVEWLREHNAGLPRGRARAGFYGMDLYSLYGSIDAVLSYLDRMDPDAARRARQRYGCFERFGEDPQVYGVATRFDLSASCEREVVEQLTELTKGQAEYTRLDGRVAEDEYFQIEQNARLVQRAEEYYRTMFRGAVSSWNLRDQYMVETVEALVAHLDRFHAPTKAVLWAHNSHLGDARATQMGELGEWNVGQLLRERHGSEAFLVGFTTHAGTVTAASDWGGPAEIKRVRPSLPDSYERLLHDAGLPRSWLNLRSEAGARRELVEALREGGLERAIGVLYLPETERMSHYFHARLSDQFDAVIHVDETSAVQPLEWVADRREREAEAYPTGV
ncbi:erythromycin esterase [Sorangium cellulosum]|uniref:Erythromycin esterase n=1 Tax=Sorangium cellulosum TaxID=56 RepID=A0A4P2PUE6_SORCE|nr:erythromycin esterase family protein [Sorangium cellulosum]AUX20228.1 erythromycin esterase [Sorangium cellulosum]